MSAFGPMPSLDLFLLYRVPDTIQSTNNNSSNMDWHIPAGATASRLS